MGLAGERSGEGAPIAPPDGGANDAPAILTPRRDILGESSSVIAAIARNRAIGRPYSEHAQKSLGRNLPML